MKKRLIQLLSAIMLVMTVSVQAVEKITEDSLDEIAKRGAHVMPFSLEKTTHIFQKTRTAVCSRLSSKILPISNKSN